MAGNIHEQNQRRERRAAAWWDSAQRHLRMAECLLASELGEGAFFHLCHAFECAYAQDISRAVGQEPNAAYLTDPGIPFDVWDKGELNDTRLNQKIGRAQLGLAAAAIETTVGLPEIIPPIEAGEGHRTKASKDSEAHPQNNFAVPGFKARHLVRIRNKKESVKEITGASIAVNGTFNRPKPHIIAGST